MTTAAAFPARRGRDVRLDRQLGSVAPMMLGFLLILVVLLTVVIGASKAFLVQRQLAAAADAATLAGADGYDTSDIYNGTGASDVGLDPVRACALARASFAQNIDGLPAGQTVFDSCVVNGRRISIGVHTTAYMPIVRDKIPASLRVTADSSAEGRS